MEKKKTKKKYTKQISLLLIRDNHFICNWNVQIVILNSIKVKMHEQIDFQATFYNNNYYL